MSWDPAAYRSLASPPAFRNWKAHYREEKTKSYFSVESATGGKERKDVNPSFYWILWSNILHFHSRLDINNQKIDKGYPRYTDVVFGGVPNDSHDVFQFKGRVKNSILEEISFLFLSNRFLNCISTLGHFYFCRDRFYWRMNSQRQVDRVGYVKYDILKCVDS